VLIGWLALTFFLDSFNCIRMENPPSKLYLTTPPGLSCLGIFD